MDSFQMRQCLRCLLRYPAPAAGAEGALCPTCGSSAPFITEPFQGRVPAAPPLSETPRVEALLDNLRSIFNVGSIFRTADGAGITHLHLCGITATPHHPKLAKTALGAESAVPWDYHPNALDAAHLLQEQGRQLWALESSEQSTSLFDSLPPPGSSTIVLIAGNERAGVDPALLALCDRVVHIPMQGMKESLNVAIAFSIAAYYLRYLGEK